MRSICLASLASLLLVVLGCHSHDEAYANLQDCFDDHHINEGFDPTQSITICVLEHLDVSFTTAAECETYVGANLATTDATPAEVTAGCQDYIDQKGL
jgi:uncharacterized protein YcfL